MICEKNTMKNNYEKSVIIDSKNDFKTDFDTSNLCLKFMSVQKQIL